MNERQEIIDYVSLLVLGLCKEPQLVSIKATDEKDVLHFHIFAPEAELGRLIGKNGDTANSLRTLARVRAYPTYKSARIKIEGPEKEAAGERETSQAKEA